MFPVACSAFRSWTSPKIFLPSLLIGPWFRLGAWTINRKPDERGVENVVLRKSLLLPPDGFAEIFGNLTFIGNAIDHLGKPGGSFIHKDEHNVYQYTPFYRFEMELSSVIAEPLVSSQK
jgi:hypothetical protein